MALWVSVGSLSQRNVLHLLSWSLGQKICLKIVAIIWICLQTWSTMLPTYSLFFYQVLYTFNSTLKQTSNLLQIHFQNWQTTVKRFKKMTWRTTVRKKPNVQHLLQAKLLKPSISLPFFEKYQWNQQQRQNNTASMSRRAINLLFTYWLIIKVIPKPKLDYK